MDTMIEGLVIDTATTPWETSRGFEKRRLAMPVLDEAHNPTDATSVIVKVLFAGVCGSDRGLWNRAAFRDLFVQSLKQEDKTIRVVGHEFVGEIVAAGSMVETLYSDPDPQNLAKVKVGSLVSGDSHVTCGRCYQCRLGEAHVCRDQAILGISTDGVFAEYIKLPAKNLWPVDISRVRPEIAAIFDPFGNAVHATTKVDFRGQRIAVFGCGPIGLFSILLARNFGSGKIIGIDVNPANLELAKQLGADEIIQVQPDPHAKPYDTNPEVLERIMELTYGKGVDVSMEMAGQFSSINNAISATRLGGDVILFGIKDGDLTIPNFSRVITSGLTLHSIIGRELFRTWQISQRILSQRANGIQDAIWEVMLRGGKDTIVPLNEFEPKSFEQKMNTYPKLLFKVGG